MSRPRIPEPNTLIEIKVLIAARKVDLPEIRSQVLKRGAYHVIEEWGAQIIEETVTESRGVHALELGARKPGVRGTTPTGSD